MRDDIMKCRYCNGSSVGEFCSKECRTKGERYQENVKKNAKLFLIGVLSPFLLIIPGLLFIDYVFLFMAIMIFIMAAAFIVFPFSTPETIQMMGIKGSMQFTRGCGVVFILMGILFIVAAFFG
jgi:hypothetical protein